MKTLLMLLATIGALPGLAAEKESAERERMRDRWIAQTQPGHALAERRRATMALGQIAHGQSRDWAATSITPTLVQLLKDKEPEVRAEAALAICCMWRDTTEAAIPALIELLQDRHDGVRGNAAHALCFRGTTAEPAIPALVKVVSEDASHGVRV